MKAEDITIMLICSVPFVAGVIALLFTVFLWLKVNAADPGEGKQVEISQTVQKGAMAFLKTEYTYLVPFVVIMSIFFFVEEWVTRGGDEPGSTGWQMIVCFIVGASLSAASGWGGMMIATECNVKTAEAAKTSLTPALVIAFAGGAVMGFIVVGLGIIGLVGLFFLFSKGWENNTDKGTFPTALYSDLTDAFTVLAGFSFGASSIALFARVAGGIYTKAADVGADLVGKVEEDFPEDSYYNPATIADNVGDNVGDVAGMGADLFESYVGSIVAAATLAMTSHCVEVNGLDVCVPDMRRVALPFWVAGFGIIASVVGYFAVGCQNLEGVEDDHLQHALLSALHSGVYSAAAIALALSALSVFLLFGVNNDNNDNGYDWVDGWKDFGCLVIGLATGIFIGEATEHFTSFGHDPTRSITKAGVTGPATVIIQGLGIGMLSAVPPVVAIAAAVMACSALSGVYGAALAAVGMLATLGVTLATDAYGPVADNAGGVAEMAHLPPLVRQRTDALDALGNTTAATGKGFAVGSAVLTALAFMNAFSDKVKATVLDDIHNANLCNGANAPACATIKQLEFGDFFALTNPLVLSGLLIGAMLPFLFAALTMLSVGKAATGIILEVRRQLKEIPKLKELAIASTDEGWTCPEEDKDVKPQVEACVTICTVASLKEMLIPGALAVMTPIGVGLLVGARCLGGLLMGSIATGFLLAVMMNNAGGAWDNSKKWVENDGQPRTCSKEFLEQLGHPVPKGSAHHSAVVTGDTVGDPFKDTSGPALNILIKLMSVLSLTCAKMFKNDWDTWYSGVAVLAVEAIFCGVCFYFVWYTDTTMDVLNTNKQDGLNVEMGAMNEEPAGSEQAAASEEESVTAADGANGDRATCGTGEMCQ